MSVFRVTACDMHRFLFALFCAWMKPEFPCGQAGGGEPAIAVMKEIGIDISTQTSKAIHEKLLKQIDVIVTLCGHAEAMCPMTPPEIKKIHWPINDPVGATGTEEEIMNAFRKARDEIKGSIGRLINKLRGKDIK